MATLVTASLPVPSAVMDLTMATTNTDSQPSQHDDGSNTQATVADSDDTSTQGNDSENGKIDGSSPLTDASSSGSTISKEDKTVGVDDLAEDAIEETEAVPDWHDDRNYLYERYMETVTQLSKGDPGQNLVSGVMDYMRVVDQRLRLIEEKLQSNIPDDPTPEEEPAVDGDDVLSEANTADIDINNVLLEANLFEAEEGDFNPDGFFLDKTQWSGAFASTIGPSEILRAMYSKASDAAVDRTNQDASEIDIIYISIWSDPIASFFRDVLLLDCGSGNSIQLTKPFRPLISNINSLREHLSKLESAYGNSQSNDRGTGNIDDLVASAQTSTESPSNTDCTTSVDSTGPVGSNSSYGDAHNAEQLGKTYIRPSALPHFRVVLQFVDHYLSSSLKLYERLKSGQEDKVAFENLWMLYDAGALIYCPYRSSDGSFTTFDNLSERSGAASYVEGELTEPRPRYSPQAYCVLSVRGGIPLRKDLVPGWDEEDDLDNDLFHGFDTLRLGKLRLFRHGEFGTFRKDAQQLTARQDLGGAPKKRRSQTTSSLIIACFCIDYDGDQFGAQREFFEIKPYDGLKDIRGIEVYPAHYIGEREGDRLLARGRKFLDLMESSHMAYEGTTAGHLRETINSEVIVDFKMAYEQDQNLADESYTRPIFSTGNKNDWPRSSVKGGGETHDWHDIDGTVGHACAWRSSQNATYYRHQDAQSSKVLRKLSFIFESHTKPEMQNKQARRELRSYLEENNLINLFPGVVPGYALRSRKWVLLDLDVLQYVQHSDDWGNLVLPRGHRDMVQAMVESYTRRPEDSFLPHDQATERIDMDLGCIILLHGAPGVGKTSTAECVAAYTKRPLYPITCGDIGHVPETVEKNLEKHFKLAHRWACVLLLDEADVFLAKRTKSDVKRNGLVSVFLRILEYYPGILFLTTNRVGAIDDAFRSRLHLTLYYPKLVEKQSTKIWKNNIRKLEQVNELRVKKGQQPIKYDKDEIVKWAKVNWESLQWNGRQIRNAFQTAIALAEFKAQSKDKARRTGKDSSSPTPRSPKRPVLSQDTFTLIAEASTQFNDYLLQTHGQDEDTTASRDQIRPATFKENKTRIKRVQESSDSDTDSDSTSSSGDSSRDSDSAASESGPDPDASDNSEISEPKSEVEKKRKKSKKSKEKLDKTAIKGKRPSERRKEAKRKEKRKSED
ncbi:hypothetical protein CGGC5_v004325 [Colletotrichum fructicola Nara gc5]|uniref:AAA+ ATPase domain-containing protein n=1 Tax=Colletotrichum fructicola (strain Nara gc5) TaxID=1213859 RepID=A0A7J6JEZ8_COLFN|nr:hypothetical protein CGGC5_v004325 [Colletotrichum fructicola Nara gc5]KAF5504489.1 hypothetical protein CGCF413_v004465 [Colletotrichum fructicola]